MIKLWFYSFCEKKYGNIVIIYIAWLSLHQHPHSRHVSVYKPWKIAHFMCGKRTTLLIKYGRFLQTSQFTWLCCNITPPNFVTMHYIRKWYMNQIVVNKPLVHKNLIPGKFSLSHIFKAVWNWNSKKSKRLLRQLL